MRTCRLADGVTIPVVGQGTWRMGDDASARSREVAALRLGLDLGMTVIDTAEMYADGRAEEIVGEAIAGRRDEVFLVSKVLPQNASRKGTITACEASLRRLKVDHLDLYLLHWEGPHPISKTIDAFVALRDEGKIARFGVSNFDLRELSIARDARGGSGIVANQVLYNVAHRGIDFRLRDECRRMDVLVMAYSPLHQGALLMDGALSRVAARHGATPAQIALAWTIREPGVVTIPKSVDPQRLRENAAAADIELTPEDLAEIDSEFEKPTEAVPLETT
jgi:diketogulonate reductase-like aldo/keto reductase